MTLKEAWAKRQQLRRDENHMREIAYDLQTNIEGLESLRKKLTHEANDLKCDANAIWREALMAIEPAPKVNYALSFDGKVYCQVNNEVFVEDYE